MGSGFKDWTAGDVLTASDVDGYLMRQTIMTFATTSARDTALSGVLDEGMFCYTEDTDSVWYYNGSAWVGFHTGWTSFTPSWTNVTEGTGVSNTGRYKYVGGDMFLQIRLVLGNGGSMGTNPYFTLPDSITAKSGIGSLGLAIYDRDSTSEEWTGITKSVGGATACYLYCTSSVGQDNLSATFPFTWAADDAIIVQMTVAQ